jgi:hypothetical protein
MPNKKTQYLSRRKAFSSIGDPRDFSMVEEAVKVECSHSQQF